MEKSVPLREKQAGREAVMMETNEGTKEFYQRITSTFPGTVHMLFNFTAWPRFRCANRKYARVNSNSMREKDLFHGESIRRIDLKFPPNQSLKRTKTKKLFDVVEFYSCIEIHILGTRANKLWLEVSLVHRTERTTDDEHAKKQQKQYTIEEDTRGHTAKNACAWLTKCEKKNPPNKPKLVKREIFAMVLLAMRAWFSEGQGCLHRTRNTFCRMARYLRCESTCCM